MPKPRIKIHDLPENAQIGAEELRGVKGGAYRLYTLVGGTVHFGDGLKGVRPPTGGGVAAGSYKNGAGDTGKVDD